MTIADILIWGHQRAVIDSGGDCVSDVDAVDTRAGRFHRMGLAVSDRPSAGESSLPSLVAKIRRVLVPM